MHMLLVVRHRLLVDTLEDHLASIVDLALVFPGEDRPPETAPVASIGCEKLIRLK